MKLRRLGLVVSALTLWACAKGVSAPDEADAGAARGGRNAGPAPDGTGGGGAGETAVATGGSGGGVAPAGGSGGVVTPAGGSGGSVTPAGGTTSTGASCVDGIMNGLETDVDCGQVCPRRCGLGQGCEIDADCAQLECNNGICGYCGNGVLDGDETGVDCGGSCPGCLGDPCTLDTDCAADNVCGNAGVCTHCGNELTDGDETGDDCGGSCPGCYGDPCTTEADCMSGACDAAGTCTYDHCVAGWDTDPLGQECQDAQPGGPSYQSDRVECADILLCYMQEDCGPGSCPEGMCLPQSGTAAQGIAERVYAAMCP